VGFRNPIRSLPADDITGGQFTDAYTLSGTLIVGNPAGAHIEIDGSVPSEKLYATDGVTVLVDLEPTGPTFTGRVQTGLAGQRVTLDPAFGIPGVGTLEALGFYSGRGDERTPGYMVVNPADGELQIAPPDFTPSGPGSTPFIDLVGSSGTVDGSLQLGVGNLLTVDTAAFGELVRWAAGTRGGALRLMPFGGADVIVAETPVAGAVGIPIVRNDLGWTAPTLANGWSDFGGGWQTSRFTKLVTGQVVVEGLITGGTTTVGTRLFTLPVGYRPASDRIFGVIAGGAALCRVDVHADGTVTLGSAPSNTYLSLGAIMFTAGL
jgi:hypothetical protein